jgi:hypothetical protein
MAEKKRNWIGIAILLMLLVVIPVVSYLWMKAGFDYQVNARSELVSLGPVPALPEATIFGDTLIGKKMGKQVQLLGYFDPTESKVLEISGKYLSEIHEQFDEVDWFRMEFLVPETAQNALDEYVAEKGMKDPQQVFYYATQQPLAQINKQLHIGSELQSFFNTVALADTSGTIVNYYDLREGTQFVRLIEHIAMLRPQETDQEEDALFQRERDF